jgi:hypothetical protein
MAAQTNILETWKWKGRKRRECQRTPAKEQYVKKNGSGLCKKMGFPN